MRTRKVRSAPKERRQVKRQTKRIKVGTAGGFPPSEAVTLRYSDMQAYAPGSTYGQWTYRGNSLFDPDFSGGGHQPRYYDTYSSVYQYYRVNLSKIKITVSNYQAMSSVVMVVVPHTDIITATSYAAMVELPYAKRTEQVPISTRMGAKSTITASASTMKICGLTKGQLQDQDFSASVGANPTRLWYWNIAFFDALGAQNVSVVFDVDLSYECIFYELADPGLSLIRISDKDYKNKPGDQITGVTNIVLLDSAQIPLPVVLAPGRK